MDPLWFWVIGLILAAAVLFAAEVIIPSGGLLGFCSVVCLVVADVFLFVIDTTYGAIGLLALFLLVPTGTALALKLFPHTPVGRAMLAGAAHPKGAESQDAFNDLPGDDLVGAEGLAETPLHPVGFVRIGRRRIECLSETGAIEEGDRVRVTSVSGIEVRVRPVDDEKSTNA